MESRRVRGESNTDGMAERARGTVTSLASMFPAEEVRKAAERVEEAIAEKRKEVERFREFISDNSNLVNLVQKLPEELHHDVMVPFGKAAFFPGRLIHTNEFMVLLGEGYFVERTSKQTVEILKRRGKYLESNANAAKAVVEDLKAEASFFGSTASELAEDLVEIREELSDEESDASVPESGPHEQGSNSYEGYKGKVPNQDEEYARIMARLDELEKEELAAERADDYDEEDTIPADSDIFPEKSSFSDEKSTDSMNLAVQSKDRHASTEEILGKRQEDPHFLEQLNDSMEQLDGLKVQSPQKGDKSSMEIQKSKHDMNTSRIAEVDPVHSAVKESRQVPPLQSSKPSHDSLKAFTGSIIEHPVNLPMKPGQQSGTSSQVELLISLSSLPSPSMLFFYAIDNHNDHVSSQRIRFTHLSNLFRLLVLNLLNLFRGSRCGKDSCLQAHLPASRTLIWTLLSLMNIIAFKWLYYKYIKTFLSFSSSILGFSFCPNSVYIANL
ncbi:RNA polymerase II subunit 5-mediating protein homolog isoform X2 [Punica granatum]|uniref:RNA polymerase II subunit 5-mediating protein homolog isoform X2 n=1 Tax=Punica granatum TaxID=22663 RepID=A0A6P8DE99_PUNGR|nr:RNA polymerase II subunit 5-mediating protein homolog isoform X2 [Punica granatum]